ncbi:flagellar hook assembly protein FlgD [Solibacillus sp. FSL H8-0538]|uniref:flagellar hook assembly protein FlgD n=1 Tax=Solibacillus sp. FSL H8-0538 TaxID=2921400 RepID=UPI0030FB0B0F
MTNSINDGYYLPAASNVKYTTEKDNGALGKDAFLKLLVTQLQNQDPTSPMDDKEFIAQMAQFSSLEQMQNMTLAMEALLGSQQQTQMMSYTNFIGKEVKWDEITEEKDSEGNYITNSGTGVITELKFVKGEPVFILEGGKEITPGNISSILSGSSSTGNTNASNPFAEASQLIGKKVQYKDGEELVQAIIEAITTKNGVIEYVLNNGTRLTKDKFEVMSSTDESTEDPPTDSE